MLPLAGTSLACVAWRFEQFVVSLPGSLQLFITASPHLAPSNCLKTAKLGRLGLLVCVYTVHTVHIRVLVYITVCGSRCWSLSDASYLIVWWTSPGFCASKIHVLVRITNCLIELMLIPLFHVLFSSDAATVALPIEWTPCNGSFFKMEIICISGPYIAGGGQGGGQLPPPGKLHTVWLETLSVYGRSLWRFVKFAPADKKS